MDLCGCIGRMSLFSWKPKVLHRRLIIMLRTKSGTARRLALKSPNPPLLTLSWDINNVSSGISVSFCICRMSLRKVVVSLSIPLGNCPNQLNQCSVSVLCSGGKLCIISESKRCGSFCMVHCVKSFIRVWTSGIAFVLLVP